MTVMNPNSKIVEQDPATWKGLLFRIFDAPSRSLCVLTIVTAPLLSVLLVDPASTLLGLPAPLAGASGCAGLLLVRALLQLARHRRDAIAPDTGCDVAEPKPDRKQ